MSYLVGNYVQFMNFFLFGGKFCKYIIKMWNFKNLSMLVGPVLKYDFIKENIILKIIFQ